MRQRVDNPVVAVYRENSPSKNYQHSQGCTRRRTAVAYSGAAPFVPDKPLDELRGEPGGRDLPHDVVSALRHGYCEMMVNAG